MDPAAGEGRLSMDYTIENEQLRVRVSDFGAQLQSILGADGTEYLWQGDPAFWGDRAPNIFPYVARLTEGKYLYNGQTYPMKIHGIVKYQFLQAETVSKDSVIFLLQPDEQILKQYPFDFRYRLTYSLHGNELRMSHAIENCGSSRMYFGLGGHIGFNVPLGKGLKFDDYLLEFDSPCKPDRVGFTPDVFLNGQSERYPLKDDRQIPLRHSLFDDDAIVLKNAARKVTLRSECASHGVTVEYPDYPVIAFWHAVRREAPYVCIEPWSSLPSRSGVMEDISQQSDLISLEPEKTYRNNWSVHVF